ncbi:uncharacterized protein LOC119174417 isoform X3 [Rhipicephalus microplus]|uniref:uncharacterized protein LOC119174417 isoform X3 n=1 Tax=Rhipicephalus microplus TaxID=6941 RepID=UPI003F6C7E98
MSDHQFAVELCKRVERYPELYDISHEGFLNENAKRLAWKAIASELGAQPSKCKTKWKAIKHQFVKARKDCTTAWELWSSLKFLDEAANRKTSSLPDDALFILTRSALESARAGKPLQHLTAVPTPPTTRTTATPSVDVPSLGSNYGPDVFLLKETASQAHVPLQQHAAQQPTVSRVAPEKRSFPSGEKSQEEHLPGRSNVKAPSPKRPRSGRSSTGEADKGLEDMTWASAQNIRFFKQMQEKFARLSPEVVWTMKADILNMLDKAAKP